MTTFEVRDAAGNCILYGKTQEEIREYFNSTGRLKSIEAKVEQEQSIQLIVTDLDDCERLYYLF